MMSFPVSLKPVVYDMYKDLRPESKPKPVNEKLQYVGL